MDGSALDFWKSYDGKKKTIFSFGDIEAKMEGNFEETNGNSHRPPRNAAAYAPPDVVAEAIPGRPVDDCTVYPYSSVGVIIAKYKEDESYFICSAYIIGESKVMTAAHAFDFDRKPNYSIFVPQVYNADLLEDEKNKYGYFTIDAKTLKVHPKYKPTTFKEKIHERIPFLFSKKPLNPAFDICTAEVDGGSKFNNFEEAELKPIQLRHLNVSFDVRAINMIVGCALQEDKTVTMRAVEGTILPDQGNSYLLMNKRVKPGMSGGPWLIGSSAVGVQSSVKNQSSYSPYFEPQLFEEVDSGLILKTVD